MVCPVIDVIDWNTFEYLGNPGEPQIGGFDWRLVFTWHVVPERERLQMRSPIDVIRSASASRGSWDLAVMSTMTPGRGAGGELSACLPAPGPPHLTSHLHSPRQGLVVSLATLCFLF